MTLVLITGLFFVAVAAALLVHAFVQIRSRAGVTVDHISSYGYINRPGTVELADAADAVSGTTGRSLSHGFGALVTVIGKRFAGGLSVPSEQRLRRRLLAAGMYTTSPAKFFGVQAVSTALLPLFWLWLSISAGKSTAVIVVGTIVTILAGWFGPVAF